MLTQMELRTNKVKIDDFISLKDKEFYEYYKKNRKKVSKGIERYTDWSRAVGRILVSIRNLLIESEGGVYVENLGYFAVFKTYRKTDKSRKDGTIDSLIKNYRYYPYFFGETGKNCFKNWFMAMTFAQDVLVKTKEQIEKGFKYKLHLSIIKGLIASNKETRTKC